MRANNLIFNTIDISTRPKRRRAVSLIIDVLMRIRNAEIAYMERIPENFQLCDAYAAADESIDTLTYALDLLSDAY